MKRIILSAVLALLLLGCQTEAPATWSVQATQFGGAAGLNALSLQIDYLAENGEMVRWERITLHPIVDGDAMDEPIMPFAGWYDC